jgi:DNA helicase IV
VVPARLAKGLEFDAVIVVEPAEIAADDPHGARLLFVALTRAVQHLALAHAHEMPEVLRS